MTAKVLTKDSSTGLALKVKDAQLAPLESIRVSAVVRDVVEKVDVLGIMSPNVAGHTDELSQMVSDEISRIIGEQRRLQGRYQDLLTQRSQLKNMTNKARLKEIQVELEQVGSELRYATKLLTRNLTENPNVTENLMKVQTERENLRELLNQLLNELADAGTFKSLLRALESESRSSEQIKATTAHEKHVQAELAKVRQELIETHDERRREEANQTQQIEKLKEDLQELKATMTLDTKYQRKAVLAQAEAARRVYAHQEKLADQELGRLRKQLEIEDSVHAETNAFLERKQQKLQEQTEYWDAKYEQDMDDRERALNDLKNKKALAEAKLKDLRAKYQEVDAWVTKEHRLAEAKAYALEMYQKRTQASLIIQNAYRLYRKRRKAKQLLIKYKKIKKREERKAAKNKK